MVFTSVASLIAAPHRHGPPLVIGHVLAALAPGCGQFRDPSRRDYHPVPGAALAGGAILLFNSVIGL